MQENETTKKSKFGNLGVIIIFLAVVTAPSLLSDSMTRSDIANTKKEIITLENKLITPTVALPSITPTATPSAVFKNVLPVKTTVAPSPVLRK